MYWNGLCVISHEAYDHNLLHCNVCCYCCVEYPNSNLSSQNVSSIELYLRKKFTLVLIGANFWECVYSFDVDKLVRACLFKCASVLLMVTKLLRNLFAPVNESTTP